MARNLQDIPQVMFGFIVSGPRLGCAVFTSALASMCVGCGDADSRPARIGASALEAAGGDGGQLLDTAQGAGAGGGQAGALEGGPAPDVCVAGVTRDCRPMPGEEGAGAGGGQAGAFEGEPAPDVCVPGTMRDCRVMLGEHERVVSCFVGVQLCLDGQWGPCQRRPDPDDAAEHAQKSSEADQS
jgi:hypothetical protein